MLRYGSRKGEGEHTLWEVPSLKQKVGLKSSSQKLHPNQCSKSTQKEATPRKMDDGLYQVAQAIKTTAGDALVCRYSVITFAIILPRQTSAAGEALSQAILQQMQERAIASPISPLTLSIGLITVHPTPAMDLEAALLDPCERRLQQARSKGGNGWASS